MHWLMKSDSILNTILQWMVLLSIYQTNMSILTLDWIQATLVVLKSEFHCLFSIRERLLSDGVTNHSVMQVTGQIPRSIEIVRKDLWEGNKEEGKLSANDGDH